MSSLHLDRVDAVLEGEEDEEEELEQHFERQIEQERGRQVRNFRQLLNRNADARLGILSHFFLTGAWAPGWEF
jgi:hypothetical protein